MKSSNPVLGRLIDRSTGHAGFRRAPAPQPYGGQPYGGQPYGGQPGYPPPPGGSPLPAPPGYGPPATQRMTIDDVVVRTVMLLGVVGLFGAGAWFLVPESSALTPLILFGSLGVGLVLGLIISFKGITNPPLILAYAAVEGVLVGIISRYFENLYSGIVLQAVAATFGVFFGMAALYKFRVIRATPTFAKWVMGALIGVLVLMAVNFLLAIFGVNDGAGLGLRDGGPLAIVFSLVCIGVAAMTFVLDFKAIDDGVQFGVEQRYAWYASFGILVGLIWLYLEILRLIGYARR